MCVWKGSGVNLTHILTGSRGRQYDMRSSKNKPGIALGWMPEELKFRISHPLKIMGLKVVYIGTN